MNTINDILRELSTLNNGDPRLNKQSIKKFLNKKVDNKLLFKTDQLKQFVESMGELPYAKREDLINQLVQLIEKSYQNYINGQATSPEFVSPPIRLPSPNGSVGTSKSLDAPESFESFSSEQPLILESPSLIEELQTNTIEAEADEHIQEVRQDIIQDLIQNLQTEEIGKGTFGQVYLVEYNGTPMALKEVDTQRGFYPLEAYVLSSARHPNLLCSAKTFTKDNNLYFMLPVAENNLSSYIFDRVGRKYVRNPYGLTFNAKCKFISDIAEGIYFLHSKMKVTHADLKPENVLVFSDRYNNSWTCKVADFGSCQYVQKEGGRKVDKKYFFPMSHEIITRGYRSPLMYTNREDFNEINKIGITNRIDVWSFGVIAFELFFELRLHVLAQQEDLSKKRTFGYNFFKDRFDGDNFFLNEMIELHTELNRYNGNLPPNVYSRFVVPLIDKIYTDPIENINLKDFFSKVFEHDEDRRPSMKNILDSPLLSLFSQGYKSRGYALEPPLSTQMYQQIYDTLTGIPTGVSGGEIQWLPEGNLILNLRGTESEKKLYLQLLNSKIFSSNEEFTSSFIYSIYSGGGMRRANIPNTDLQYLPIFSNIIAHFTSSEIKRIRYLSDAVQLYITKKKQNEIIVEERRSIDPIDCIPNIKYILNA